MPVGPSIGETDLRQTPSFDLAAIAVATAGVDAIARRADWSPLIEVASCGRLKRDVTGRRHRDGNRSTSLLGWNLNHVGIGAWAGKNLWFSPRRAPIRRCHLAVWKTSGRTLAVNNRREHGNTNDTCNREAKIGS